MVTGKTTVADPKDLGRRDYRNRQFPSFSEAHRQEEELKKGNKASET